jgi:hypothetical protein
MTIASAEVAPAGLPEPEVVTEANAEAAALDLEIAQDMAVLDAIALEMAEPGVVEQEPAVSELAVSELAPVDVPESEPAEPDVSESDIAETALAEPPRIVEPDGSERGMVESMPVESRPAQSVNAEPDSVALASAIFIALKPEQPSLGATLIANGILSGRTAANDALTPFRRMSQAERIAFFS